MIVVKPGQKYYMLRLMDEEVLGCTNCGETTKGSNTDVRYVWAVVRLLPDLKMKDELDIYCPGCWEKEEGE